MTILSTDEYWHDDLAYLVVCYYSTTMQRFDYFDKMLYNLLKKDERTFGGYCTCTYCIVQLSFVASIICQSSSGKRLSVPA